MHNINTITESRKPTWILLSENKIRDIKCIFYYQYCMHIQNLHDRPHYSIKSVCACVCVCVCVCKGGGGVLVNTIAPFLSSIIDIVYTCRKNLLDRTHFSTKRGVLFIQPRPFLIEVPVIYQQSERSMISVLGCNGFASVSTMFNFNSSDGVISFCFSLFS